MKILVAIALLALGTAGSAAATDPLASLKFLVGNWVCTYDVGKTHATYRAAFAYDMGGNWLRETDAWAGGGDLGMFTYERSGWTAVILERDRSTTIFRAPGTNPNHVAYKSVYPNTDATDVFDRVSPTRFTLHYSQTTNGKTMSSMDTCIKT